MIYTDDDLRTCPVWRHVKTNSLYHVMGIARCSTNGDREGRERSVIYFSVARQTLNYREIEEFLDGRFEPMYLEKVRTLGG